MTTLISVHKTGAGPGGLAACVGRCDAKCHDAKKVKCNCVCSGWNHGAGERQAIVNTEAHFDTIVVENKKRFLAYRPKIRRNPAIAQLSLF